MLSLRRAVSADVPSLVKLAYAAYGRYVARIGRPPAPMTADYDKLVAQAQTPSREPKITSAFGRDAGDEEGAGPYDLS